MLWNGWSSSRRPECCRREGSSFIDGDKVCIRCDPNTGGGVRCYSIDGLDFMRAVPQRGGDDG